MEVEDKQKCFELLQLVIDGQATQQQTLELEQHLSDCENCRAEFELSQSIKEGLKSRLKRPSVPSELATSIQSKVLEIV
ncbi:zf-HC2 domain-containing protein [Marivirga sp. S37H4]|uniref:Zf-HC2 domain-containing protein n=1 Tax=Marivirga aurantiaca TaxID=2802615 RepID=A0A935CB93_9BACT|nr:zf-HC2 domain-containing protein [Marivirga aurantiaca]MBK6267191.1 zf-HC2 domain-containing protein [Marivirga aurantiaca]